MILRRSWNSRTRTLTFTLAALILYFPSNFYPLVTADYMGQHSATTIFDGIKSLFTKGQYFIASLVFCTSILTPALKIIGLLFLTLTAHWRGYERLRTWIYKAIRVVDPWNMLEVYLLAILVSMAEMGEIATVHPGPGVFSFAAVVVLTLFATLSFDPKMLWKAADREATESERNGEESEERGTDNGGTRQRRGRGGRNGRSRRQSLGQDLGQSFKERWRRLMQEVRRLVFYEKHDRSQHRT